MPCLAPVPVLRQPLTPPPLPLHSKLRDPGIAAGTTCRRALPGRQEMWPRPTPPRCTVRVG